MFHTMKGLLDNVEGRAFMVEIISWMPTIEAQSV